MQRGLIQALAPLKTNLFHPCFFKRHLVSQALFSAGFAVSPGFACICYASSIFQALCLLGGAVPFRSSCPSPNSGYQFWFLVLTFRSSRPAFCGRLTSPVSQLIGESVFRILLVALLAFGAWKGYEKYQSRLTAEQFQGISQEIDISNNSSRRNRSIDITPKFQCDGRTHCSQMTSCEEATFFLKNCSGTKMDGNNDGVPCEQQWCK